MGRIHYPIKGTSPGVKQLLADMENVYRKWWRRHWSVNVIKPGMVTMQVKGGL